METATLEAPTTTTIKPAQQFDPARPLPGVYRGVPARVYFAAQAVNHSTAKLLSRSPMHFRAERDNPTSSESESKNIGSLCHMMLFEPDNVAGSVIGAPINPKTGKAFGVATKAWEEYAAANPGKMIVSDEQRAEAEAAFRAVKAHETLSALFGLAAETELVLVWVDGGVLCKARLDAYVPGFIVGDLKTSRDASERAFARAMIEYCYDTQAEWYSRGARACGLAFKHFIFGVVENATPYAAAAYSPGEQFLVAAKNRVDGWLNTIAACTKASNWPGYETGIVEIQPPTWYVAKFADGE